MNKNIIKILTAGLVCCSVFAGCSNVKTNPERTADEVKSEIASKPAEVHYVFTEYEKDTPNRVSKSSDKETIYKSLSVEEIRITHKSIADREAAKKMENVLYSAAKRVESVYESELSYLLEEISAGNVDASNLPHETKVNYTVTRNDGRAISILESIESYSANNLTFTSKFAYNFEPVTGKHITSDVFYTDSNTEALSSSDALIFAKLKEKYGDVISYDKVETDFVNEAQDTWYFTEAGIVVFFNPGDIADASLGEFSVEISKEELGEHAAKYFN